MEIDDRFIQETTEMGIMLKLESNQYDISLMTNHYNLTKDEFESELCLLMSRNKNSGNNLTNKNRVPTNC